MRVTALCLLFLLSSCGGSAASGATCPTTGSTLTYENFGRAFFAQYCDRCHAASERPSLRTRAEIQTNRFTIDSEAAGGPDRVNRTMPEGGATPSDAERLQLGEWIACGAQ